MNLVSIQFTLPDVDRNDLNSTSYLLDVTAFLERSSSDERRCSTLIAGVAALAEVYPPPHGGRPCPVCRTPVERVMKVYF